MTDYIFHDLMESIGSDERAKLELVIDPDEEKVTVKLSKTYIKRYELKSLEEAKRIYDVLTGSGYVIDIDRLVEMVHTKPTNQD